MSWSMVGTRDCACMEMPDATRVSATISLRIRLILVTADLNRL